MITYGTVKERIEEILKNNVADKEATTTLHRELEIYNATRVVANQDDQPMKDVQFLVRSALFLMDVGNPDDWKAQLEAVLSLLNSCPSSS